MYIQKVLACFQHNIIIKAKAELLNWFWTDFVQWLVWLHAWKFKRMMTEVQTAGSCFSLITWALWQASAVERKLSSNSSQLNSDLRHQGAWINRGVSKHTIVGFVKALSSLLNPPKLRLNRDAKSTHSTLKTVQRTYSAPRKRYTICSPTLTLLSLVDRMAYLHKWWKPWPAVLRQQLPSCSIFPINLARFPVSGN